MSQPYFIYSNECIWHMHAPFRLKYNIFLKISSDLSMSTLIRKHHRAETSIFSCCQIQWQKMDTNHCNCHNIKGKEQSEGKLIFFQTIFLVEINRRANSLLGGGGWENPVYSIFPCSFWWCYKMFLLHIFMIRAFISKLFFPLKINGHYVALPGAVVYVFGVGKQSLFQRQT